MTKFPQLRDIQTKFLIGPGIKAQFFLASTVAMLHVGIRGLQIYSETKRDESKPDATSMSKD